jgi:Domain of Unknown Function (DUF1521)
MTISSTSAQPSITNITITDGNSTVANVPGPTTTYGRDGSVAFENQNYHIGVGAEGNINITNKNTDESYRVYGDLRVDVNGERAFNFEGTTTFTLDDGTRITIDTAPRMREDYVFRTWVSNAVTILDGMSDYGVLIENINPVQPGEITYEVATGQDLARWIIDEGNIVSENLKGEGFVAVDDRGYIQSVDQKWIHNTDLMQVFARHVINQYSGMVNLISGVSKINFLGSMYSSVSDVNQYTYDSTLKFAKRKVQHQSELDFQATGAFMGRDSNSMFVPVVLHEKMRFTISRNLQE